MLLDPSERQIYYRLRHRYAYLESSLVFEVSLEMARVLFVITWGAFENVTLVEEVVCCFSFSRFFFLFFFCVFSCVVVDSYRRYF